MSELRSNLSPKSGRVYGRRFRNTSVGRSGLGKGQTHTVAITNMQKHSFCTKSTDNGRAGFLCLVGQSVDIRQANPGIKHDLIRTYMDNDVCRLATLI